LIHLEVAGSLPPFLTLRVAIHSMDLFNSIVEQPRQPDSHDPKVKAELEE
jgi:hypothetical protein